MTKVDRWVAFELMKDTVYCSVAAIMFGHMSLMGWLNTFSDLAEMDLGAFAGGTVVMLAIALLLLRGALGGFRVFNFVLQEAQK